MNRLVILAVVLGAGCTSDPAVVSGTYTVGVTNRDNGCNFMNWTVGSMNSGISVAITQSGSALSADVTGGTGVYFDIAFGSSVFKGDIDGDHLDLKLEGTRAQTSGTCTYTYNGEIDATYANNALSGRINYVPATNGNSDCAAVAGCISYQEFSGSRPPM